MLELKVKLVRLQLVDGVGGVCREVEFIFLNDVDPLENPLSPTWQCGLS